MLRLWSPPCFHLQFLQLRGHDVPLYGLSGMIVLAALQPLRPASAMWPLRSLLFLERPTITGLPLRVLAGQWSQPLRSLASLLAAAPLHFKIWLLMPLMAIH